eukprot:766024-Hanusia_phi.AAC.7
MLRLIGQTFNSEMRSGALHSACTKEARRTTMQLPCFLRLQIRIMSETRDTERTGLCRSVSQPWRESLKLTVHAAMRADGERLVSWSFDELGITRPRERVDARNTGGSGMAPLLLTARGFLTATAASDRKLFGHPLTLAEV